jgi:hypothetical protein
MKPEKMEIVVRTYYGPEEPSTEVTRKLVAEDNVFCDGCYFDVCEDCTFIGETNCTTRDKATYSIIWKHDETI